MSAAPHHDPFHRPSDPAALALPAGGLPGIHGGDPNGVGGMITVVYELLPIAPGEGGSAVLSGSHDPSFSRPDIRGRELPPWPEEFGVELATPQPGQALIFTEKLMHSTHPYKGRGQRRTMFMKYQPYGTDRRAGNCKRHSSYKHVMSCHD